MAKVYGKPMTVRDLYTELHTKMSADPGNPAWDDKLDVRPDEGGFAHPYKFEVEDVTDECEGDCQNPQCAYNDANASKPDNEVLDEGLHFRPTLWLNGMHAA